jgi:hypothetical protein
MQQYPGRFGPPLRPEWAGYYLQPGMNYVHPATSAPVMVSPVQRPPTVSNYFVYRAFSDLSVVSAFPLFPWFWQSSTLTCTTDTDLHLWEVALVRSLLYPEYTPPTASEELSACC